MTQLHWFLLSEYIREENNLQNSNIWIFHLWLQYTEPDLKKNKNKNCSTAALATFQAGYYQTEGKSTTNIEPSAKPATRQPRNVMSGSSAAKLMKLMCSARCLVWYKTQNKIWIRSCGEMTAECYGSKRLSQWLNKSIWRFKLLSVVGYSLKCMFKYWMFMLFHGHEFKNSSLVSPYPTHSPFLFTVKMKNKNIQEYSSTLQVVGVTEYRVHCRFPSLVLTVLAGVKAGNGCTQHFNKVSHTPQVLVHVPEVCVDVVSIPGNMTSHVSRQTLGTQRT